MQTSLNELKQKVVKIAEKMYAKNFSAPTDGNISFLFENACYITRSSVAKDELSIRDLIEINMQTSKSVSGEKASTELKLHLTVYKNRSDIKAVVHAHPPYATAFALVHLPLEKNTMSEIASTLGSVPLAEYGTPSTDELSHSILPVVKRCNAVLLANHGAITFGASLNEAWHNMERLEHFAQITFYARQLGSEVEISPKNMKKIAKIRSEIYKLNYPQIIKESK